MKILLLGIFASSMMGSAVFAQAIKPQLSELPSFSVPMGCGYSLDDWRGTVIGWAPIGQPENTDENKLLLSIDGEVRAIAINSRSEDHISAYDGRYYIEIQTPNWRQTGSELSDAKATIKIRNTSAFTETNLIVRASQGC